MTTCGLRLECSYFEQTTYTLTAAPDELSISQPFGCSPVFATLEPTSGTTLRTRCTDSSLPPPPSATSPTGHDAVAFGASRGRLDHRLRGAFRTSFTGAAGRAGCLFRPSALFRPRFLCRARPAMVSHRLRTVESVGPVSAFPPWEPGAPPRDSPPLVLVAPGPAFRRVEPVFTGSPRFHLFAPVSPLARSPGRPGVTLSAFCARLAWFRRCACFARFGPVSPLAALLRLFAALGPDADFCRSPRFPGGPGLPFSPVAPVSPVGPVFAGGAFSLNSRRLRARFRLWRRARALAPVELVAPVSAFGSGRAGSAFHA